MTSEFLKGLGEFLELLSRTSIGTTLTAIGFILIFVAIGSLQRILKSKPEDTPEWLKFLGSGSLVIGVVFSAAGPSVALINLNSNPIRLTSKEESFNNLKENSKIGWAIRLIPYSPGIDTDLTINNLKTLGPEPTKYTFVASYRELKGYNVRKAVNMAGGVLRSGQRVSAIIFQVDDSLIPASGRGLLQIIQRIENENSINIGKSFLSYAGLSQEELDDLSDHTNIDSWS